MFGTWNHNSTGGFPSMFSISQFPFPTHSMNPIHNNNNNFNSNAFGKPVSIIPGPPVRVPYPHSSVTIEELTDEKEMSKSDPSDPGFFSRNYPSQGDPSPPYIPSLSSIPSSNSSRRSICRPLNQLITPPIHPTVASCAPYLLELASLVVHHPLLSAMIEKCLDKNLIEVVHIQGYTSSLLARKTNSRLTGEEDILRTLCAVYESESNGNVNHEYNNEVSENETEGGHHEHDPLLEDLCEEVYQQRQQLARIEDMMLKMYESIEYMIQVQEKQELQSQQPYPLVVSQPEGSQIEQPSSVFRFQDIHPASIVPVLQGNGTPVPKDPFAGLLFNVDSYMASKR
ncbi:MAG: hypothetical protein Sylvanvirus8_9 [Sylvanvirus sp.]|uniref:Uncharacterized protein n=1 Tax=Sylvanvirus sp. TaxID=2487774 RepID=A0A3G5AKG8_9VIRU|nr:MAG: hypothetical protein Sylvanvirus8_9 [Sylvanvirus sp.]